MSLSSTDFESLLASQETDHRVRKTLAALHGLLRSNFRSFADPAVRDALTVFEGRVKAARHILEDRSDEPSVDASAHLTRLCADLCAAYLAPRGVRCELRTDSGRLPREVYQKLSLIIVELVTSAARYAFTGRDEGCVRICFHRSDRGWTCQVADNGWGLRRDLIHGPTQVGSLARELGAKLRVRSGLGGTIVTLTLPQAPTPIQAWRARA